MDQARWITFIICAAVFMFRAPEVSADSRIWSNRGEDSGAVHSLGNGTMLVYETGPGITTLYPGPFSTPSLYTLVMEDHRPLRVISERESGMAIWKHSISVDEEEAGVMIDFVDIELPCMVRHMTLQQEIRLRLDFIPGLIIHQQETKGGGSLMIRMDPGRKIYQYYVYPHPLYHKITWSGNVTLEPDGEQEGVYYLRIGPGTSDLFLIGGPEYPDVVRHEEEVMENGYSFLLERTGKWWAQFTAGRLDFNRLFPVTLPGRDKLLRTIDDVSVMIRTQQSVQGAVIAGYPYPLGYVRDQYGVSRGYLALGYYREAREILRFYWEIWKRTGEIHCAQGIGVEGIFHIHENDEVESPGYLLLQAFDLLEKTGDREFIRMIFPMLEWCWDVQKKHLLGKMLPFNGDETYIAGGILPRSTLNDGSAEATMLFIDGGIRLLEWAGEQELWEMEKIREELGILYNVRAGFRRNFWREDQLIANNPERRYLAEMPRFRNGVCERQGPDCIVFRHTGFGGIDWTERDAYGRYQCMNCLAMGPLPPAEDSVYNLLTVSLTPLYFHSDLFSPDELKPVVDQIWQSFRKTGVLTSILSESTAGGNLRSVGYDYGLVLFSMIQTGSPGAEEVFLQTLDIVDEVGAWSEYYLGDAPSGTRCRPWESAINLEALIEFGKNYR